MKLSFTSWSFPQCSLKESIGLSCLLDINKIDLGYFYRSALKKDLLLRNNRKLVEELKKYKKEVGYNGYLSIEYVHQNYMMTIYDDVLSETIKMRDLFYTWKGV